VFESPGVGKSESPPTVFSTPLVSNCVLRGKDSYILYTCDLPRNFGRAPTVEKFNPRAKFSVKIPLYSRFAENKDTIKSQHFNQNMQLTFELANTKYAMKDF